jgi:hypothetical protein
MNFVNKNVLDPLPQAEFSVDIPALMIIVLVERQVCN